jgi:hypothetical protein
MKKLVLGNLFVALVALVATTFLAFFIQSSLWGPRFAMIIPHRHPLLAAVCQVGIFLVPGLGPLALFLRMAVPLFPERFVPRLARATVIAATVALVGTPLVLLGLSIAS